MHETLAEAEIEQLTSFDHWRAIRADDNAELVRSLAKRGYLDKMYRGKQPRDPITGRFRGGRRERIYRLDPCEEQQL